MCPADFLLDLCFKNSYVEGLDTMGFLCHHATRKRK